AEHRLEDARRARARARDEGQGDRALLGSRRHLRREKGVSRDVRQDRAAGRAPGGLGAGRSLHERLPDGGRADRLRRRERRADSPTHAIAAGLRDLTPARRRVMEKLSVTDLMSLEQYHRQRDAFRAEALAHKRRRQAAIGPNVTLFFENRVTIQYQ